MIEKLAERAEAWIGRWSFALFGLSAPSEKRCTAGEFFVGNMLLSYAATISVSLGYVLVNFRHIVARHAQGDAGKSLEFASKLFVGYAIVTFLALLVVAAISFVIYRIMGSAGTFLRHWNVWVDLLAFEPLAGLAVGLVWISDWKGFPTATAIALFAVARFAQLARAYPLLRAAHSLGASRALLAFAVGAIPTFVAFSLIVVAFGFMIVGWVVVPWWD
jgi:hypothetical protein